MADSSKTPEWRFSIKKLMIAGALVALGLALAKTALTPFWISTRADLGAYAQKYWYFVLGGFFCGCAIAGTGAMYPFKKLKLGAGLGVATGIAWLVYKLVMR